MLTKILGATQVLTMSTVSQTVTVVGSSVGNFSGLQNQTLPVVKVRIATNSQPAYVAFGTAATTSSLLIPSNHAEHFKIDNTSTVSVLSAGTAGLISITPVA